KASERMAQGDFSREYSPAGKTRVDRLISNQNCGRGISGSYFQRRAGNSLNVSFSLQLLSPLLLRDRYRGLGICCLQIGGRLLLSGFRQNLLRERDQGLHFRVYPRFGGIVARLFRITLDAFSLSGLSLGD